jgi:hypothetical protein
VKKGTPLEGFLQRRAHCSRKEFDLALRGWIWRDLDLGGIFHPWSDLSWHSWGFLISIFIYYQSWANFLKEGALGVRDPVIWGSVLSSTTRETPHMS